MKIRSQHVALVRLLEVLKHEGGTLKELMEETGISKSTLVEYLSALRQYADPPLIRISGWDRDARGAPSIPVYRMMPKRPIPDAPKPPKKTAALRQQEYRTRAHLRILACSSAGTSAS